METSSPRRTRALARLLLATTTMLAIVVGVLLSSAPATAAVIDNGITSVTTNKTTYDYTDSPWTWAQWLNTALPEADPPRNITLLHEGRLEEALRDARNVAWSWSS